MAAIFGMLMEISLLIFAASWGPLILGHNHPKVREKVIEVMQNGMSFGAPTALENELGRTDY